MLRVLGLNHLAWLRKQKKRRKKKQLIVLVQILAKASLMFMRVRNSTDLQSFSVMCLANVHMRPQTRFLRSYVMWWMRRKKWILRSGGSEGFLLETERDGALGKDKVG
ncbi:hypothetical protein NC651_014014 [Populus alba x Populus x berolinensis]|nr:hypothetical protein NC651_014014 [Populus alba x Populus x berolinensis]